MAGDVLLLRDDAGRQHRVAISADGTVTVGDVTLRVQRAADGSIRVTSSDSVLAWAAQAGDVRWVFVGGEVYTFEVERPSARRRALAHHSTLMAPMPATVRKLVAAAGDRVRKGDVLIVLEAMKMELPVRAAADGRVATINCREGDLVQPGVSLIELHEGGD